MRAWVKVVVGLAVLAVVPVASSFYAFHASRTPAAATFVVPTSSGAKAILRQLHREGLAPQPELLLLPVLLTTDYKKMKAGEYEFAAGSTPKQMVDKIIRGEVVVHKISIPEGWNAWQIRDALMNEPLLTGDVPAFSEGSLLPDTMHFQRGEPRANVVKRMQDAQQKLMDILWTTRAPNLPVQTPREAIILASVVEKETGGVDERAMVAGVFVNRLRLGMKLQSDPTVVYGIELARGGQPMGRALTTKDLQADTPHNTYTRAGLPPTPICNPGKAAIEAALNPAATDAIYFVATGHGGHNFAATLAEHNANVAAYRAALRTPSNPASNPNSPN